METTFNILSIDGGGIRGLIPAKVLADIENDLLAKTGKNHLHEHFQLICGTSTGAILAIAISLGIPAEKLVEFYKNNAKMIFPRWYLKIFPRKTKVFVGSIYSNEQLRKKLEEIFTEANGGKIPLIDDLKTSVCIPTFNGNAGEINVLKTRHNKGYNRDYKLPAHEVAMASASAPVYFAPHSFTYNNEFGKGQLVNMIDGGIFANNPALIGILEATDKFEAPVETVRLLSIGTGSRKHIIKKRWIPHNFFYWFIPRPRLMDIILDSQAQITDKYIDFLKRILDSMGKGFKYLRIQNDLGDNAIDLNTSKKHDLDRLEAIGGDLSKKNTIINFLTS